MKKEIVIPLPLPTWNRVLAMNHWERKKLRDMIHHAVSMSIRYGENWPTQTVFQGKLQLMESFMRDYFVMIRPSSSNRLLSHRKRLPALRKR